MDCRASVESYQSSVFAGGESDEIGVGYLPMMGGIREHRG